MRKAGSLSLPIALAAMLTGAAAPAEEVSALKTFSAGSPARAAEVNGNFTAVRTAVGDNHSRIAALEATIAELQGAIESLQASLTTLQGQMSAVNDSEVMALDPYLTVATAGGFPRATLTGLNLQLVNGAGMTDSANGTGNLLIGYDETLAGAHTCSVGTFSNEADCLANSQVWARSHKSGSHYLIVGSGHNYSRWGGIVAGNANTAINDYATVIGGASNTASGEFATVTGGLLNLASGGAASVAGGSFNVANGSNAHVSGGNRNTASGSNASVSGGSSRSAAATHDWAAGSLFQDF